MKLITLFLLFSPSQNTLKNFININTWYAAVSDQTTVQKQAQKQNKVPWSTLTIFAWALNFDFFWNGMLLPYEMKWMFTLQVKDIFNETFTSTAINLILALPKSADNATLQEIFV